MQGEHWKFAGIIIIKNIKYIFIIFLLERRGIGIAQDELEEKFDKDACDEEIQSFRVKAIHINKAAKQMHSSGKTKMIQRLSLHPLLLICSLVKQIRITGRESQLIKDVFERHHYN